MPGKAPAAKVEIVIIMKVRPMRESDYDYILEIVEKLKQVDKDTGWFNEYERKKGIPFDIRIQRSFVAEENGKIVGFISYLSEYAHPKIGWIGVEPNYQRKGIGKKLIEAVEKEAKKFGAKELSVDTVPIGDAMEKTFKFYQAMDFKVKEKYKTKSADTGKEIEVTSLRKVLK